MTDPAPAADLLRLVRAVASALPDHRDELNRLDGVAGDGDLDVAVEAVVTRALEDIGPQFIVRGDPLAGLGGEGI